ncbi:facilitated trehalose transporter Tret1 [Lasioglossum baleicum]|uniref:facilitated trehalose transporter Tret1 n=1 Tax=Lasioglossum baleicum TaxID=434251 RepID=UPI003FCD69E0
MTETEKIADKVAEEIDGQTQSDDKKKDKISIYPQIIASVVVNLTFLVCGLCYAWPSVTLRYYDEDNSPIKMTSEQRSWVVTALSIGAIIGPFSAALLVDRIGRKLFLIATCLPFGAGWIILYFAKSWVLLFVGRLLTGMPTGAIFAAAPLFIGEIVETRIRGAANMMISIFLNAGYVIIYGIGPLVDPKLLALICLVPTILVLIWLPWLPESPYYYLKKNNEKDANLSLIWLRRDTTNTETIEEMTKFIELEKKGSLKELFTKPVNRKALYIMLVLILGQQLSGVMAIQSYVGVLFDDIHSNLGTDRLLLILGAISIFSCFIAVFIIDRVGRKPLYLFSAFGTVICLALIGTYFLLYNRFISINVKSYALVPAVLLIVYHVVNSIGLGSIPAIVSSEIFPLGVKMWASAVINTIGAALGLIVSKSYEPISKAAGEETIFYIFAGVELILAILAIFIMPETSKKSFFDIQKELMNTTKKDIEEEEKEITETKEQLA